MENINNTHTIDLTDVDKTTPKSTESRSERRTKLIKSPKLGQSGSQVTPVQQVPSNADEKAKKEI